MTKPRIYSGYCEGSNGGDYGYSTMLNGTKLRKDDVACLVYSNVEFLNNTINELLETCELQDKELVAVLDWLRANSFSISSFCFLMGDTFNHVLPESLLVYMTERIEELKAVSGNAPDFIIHQYQQLRLLDKIRIEVRQLESSFVGWFYHEKVLQHLLKLLRIDPIAAQQRLANMDLTAAVLNRLSSFIWWCTRYEHNLLQSDGQISTETYWHSKVLPFKPGKKGIVDYTEYSELEGIK